MEVVVWSGFSTYRDAAVFAILILASDPVKPSGLLGKNVREKVVPVPVYAPS